MISKTILTQVKRELWENKVSFIYTPIIISLLIIALSLVGTFYSSSLIHRYGENFHESQNSSASSLPQSNQQAPQTGSQQQNKIHNNKLINEIISDTGAFNGYVLTIMYANCILLFLIYAIVMGAYSLRCLFDDRKNKDILFWRSMPVSETTNVLIKLGMVLVIAPAIIMILNYIVTLVTFLVGLIFFASNGITLTYLISSAVKGGAFYIPFQIFYELVFSLLMMLPVIGFAFFASAFAKKTPFFTFAIPLVLLLVDQILDVTAGINIGVLDLFAEYGRVISNARGAFVLQESFTFHASMVFPLVVCLGIGAAFIAGAVWLRNNRYEI